MEHKRESYPDQIRRIAVDMSQMQNWYELNYAAEKLQEIADGIEEVLQQSSSTVAKRARTKLIEVLWANKGGQ